MRKQEIQVGAELAASPQGAARAHAVWKVRVLEVERRWRNRPTGVWLREKRGAAVEVLGVWDRNHGRLGANTRPHYTWECPDGLVIVPNRNLIGPWEDVEAGLLREHMHTQEAKGVREAKERRFDAALDRLRTAMGSDGFGRRTAGGLVGGIALTVEEAERLVALLERLGVAKEGT